MIQLFCFNHTNLGKMRKKIQYPQRPVSDPSVLLASLPCFYFQNRLIHLQIFLPASFPNLPPLWNSTHIRIHHHHHTHAFHSRISISLSLPLSRHLNISSTYRTRRRGRRHHHPRSRELRRRSTIRNRPLQPPAKAQTPPSIPARLQLHLHARLHRSGGGNHRGHMRPCHC